MSETIADTTIAKTDSMDTVPAQSDLRGEVMTGPRNHNKLIRYAAAAAFLLAAGISAVAISNELQSDDGSRQLVEHHPELIKLEGPEIPKEPVD